MPDSVAIKGGTLTNAIQKPCQIPAKRPVIRLINIASPDGRPRVVAINPDIALTRATREPTERSMWPPDSIQNIIPMASIST